MSDEHGDSINRRIAESLGIVAIKVDEAQDEDGEVWEFYYPHLRDWRGKPLLAGFVIANSEEAAWQEAWHEEPGYGFTALPNWSRDIGDAVGLLAALSVSFEFSVSIKAGPPHEVVLGFGQPALGCGVQVVAVSGTYEITESGDYFTDVAARALALLALKILEERAEQKGRERR